MPKKDSKNQKKSIGIKETLAGADTSLMEKQLKEQIEAPMVRLSYTYAMDVAVSYTHLTLPTIRLV